MSFDFRSLSPEAMEGLRQAWAALGAEGEPHNESTPDERLSQTCFHEAAHAVARFVFFGDDGLHLAFVCRHGGAVIENRMITRDPVAPVYPKLLRFGRERAAQWVVVCLIGIASDALFSGTTFDEAAAEHGNEGDFENLKALPRRWRLTNAKAKAVARACALIRVRSFASANLILAAALKTEGFVGANRIAEICNTHLDREALNWRHRFPKIEAS